MATRSILVTLLALTALAQQASAQVSAVQVLARVSRTYRGLRTYKLDAIEREVESVRGLGNLALGQANTSLAADAGGKVRAYREDDRGTLLMVSNGENTWVYDSALRKYTQERAAVDWEEHLEDSAFDDQEWQLVGKPVDTVRFGRQGRHLSINTARSSADLFRQIRYRLIGQYIGIDHYDPDARLRRSERIKVGDQRIDCFVIALDSGTHKLWVDKRRFIVVRHDQTLRMARSGKNAVIFRVELADFTISEPLKADLFEFKPPAGAAKVSQLDLPGIRARLAGNPAPDFTASTLDGQAVSLSDFRGKVVLLYFWATWCGQCRLEQPVVAGVYEKYKDRGLVTFGVTGEDQATVRHYLEENRLRLPILLDSKRTLRRLYGSLAIPTLVFINTEGVVTEDYVGLLDESDLRVALQTAGLQAD
jgi:peroxiredoxin/outer membrane lipoprotein-sorting protein